MMIEMEKPNIVRIAFYQESGDPHYGQCLWAYFDFDLDKYMLNIQSDAENGQYRWYATPESESFLQLCSRIDDGYLIHKMYHDRQVVDVDATIEGLRDDLGIGKDEPDDSLTSEEVEEREQALEDLRELLDENGGEAASRDTAINIMESVFNDDHPDFELYDIWERVCMDYTAGQKRIVQIFKDYVQPKIREILEGDHGQDRPV